MTSAIDTGARRDVLIVGAGPTGLVLALWLIRQGVKVRIVDKAIGPGTTSRAMLVQARTLELYRQLGLTDAVLAAGYKNPALNLWVKGKKRGRISFGGAGESLTPYPYMLVYPQDLHERLLVARLEELGNSVEWRTELVDFKDQGDFVVGRLRTADGAEQICEVQYLAGCDGARSAVRQQLGLGFEGGTYEQFFYVADVEAKGAAAAGEVHTAIERADFVALMAYGDGKNRLIGVVRDVREGAEKDFSFDQIGRRAVDGLGLEITKVNWFSTYRVHHRIADHYRAGRAFVLGDAAHIHSPAGGQGMNTGIGDAINLAWKLAAVVRGHAPDSLLDSFEIERRAFAKTLVATTDRLFTFLSSDGKLADFVRTRIFPIVAPIAYSIRAVREALFRSLSQLMITYRGSPACAGRAGAVHGGDRLPWARANGADNFDSLANMCWQVHVYGRAGKPLEKWCAAQEIPLYVFAYAAAHRRAGLAENAAYLVRPDTHVALAEPQGDPETLAGYLATRGLCFPRDLSQ